MVREKKTAPKDGNKRASTTQPSLRISSLSDESGGAPPAPKNARNDTLGGVSQPNDYMTPGPLTAYDSLTPSKTPRRPDDACLLNEVINDVFGPDGIPGVNQFESENTGNGYVDSGPTVQQTALTQSTGSVPYGIDGNLGIVGSNDFKGLMTTSYYMTHITEM